MIVAPLWNDFSFISYIFITRKQSFEETVFVSLSDLLMDSFMLILRQCHFSDEVCTVNFIVIFPMTKRVSAFFSPAKYVLHSSFFTSLVREGFVVCIASPKLS